MEKNMENNLETGVTYGFKELNASYSNKEPLLITLYIYIYLLW